jgi:hypothetical protein
MMNMMNIPELPAILVPQITKKKQVFDS